MHSDGVRRTVVITGASAGVGRATARRFAAGGFNVGLIARGNDGLAAAAAEIESRGRKALVLRCDVADADAVEHAAAVAEETLGPIDVWVNNAMASVFAPVTRIAPEEFRRVTDVTYLGYVYGALAALRRMKPRNRGTIVQVGSALAYRSIPLQSAYCAAKHAIVGFTESLRCELLHEQSDVHVTMVHMPALNTPQFDWVRSKLPKKAQPVPPIYQPEIAADAIFYAAHHPAREYWVARSTVKAILGERLFPGLLDRILAKSSYESQQTKDPARPNRADNLWAPVDAAGGGDFGAHGRFDQRSQRISPAWEAAKLKPWLAAAAVATAAGFAVAELTNARRNNA